MKDKPVDFDFDQAVQQLKSGQSLTGKDGLLMPLIKQLTESALQGELEALSRYQDRWHS